MPRENMFLKRIIVKFGDKEQIGVKDFFMDYQPFYTINLLSDS